MREVVEIAKTMGPEQLILALVFLGCYALALGAVSKEPEHPCRPVAVRAEMALAATTRRSAVR